MSHRPEERGAADDRLLVRPYVVPAARPARAGGPAWPQSGPPPVSFRVPAADPPPPAPAYAPPTPPADRGADRDGRRGLPRAALLLLALGATGALVYLLSGPESRDAPRASASPGLSLPVPDLPARSPGAGPAPEASGPDRSAPPSPAASASVSAAPASAAASAPAAPSASVSAGAAAPKTPRASASGPGGPPAPGTLRMGDEGEAVRDLQERLFGQGFTYVSPTGVYDSQTKRGVAQLQRDRGIKGDQPGVYGPATRAAFGG
ncbi:peptidoglycan-binding domain-containing protein [Streptomyces sp. cmx-4-9]|uniref:peptidoglycan-binding domain-containing protein n=1 Tax=Streptomyces sp. cmx-4-9 TaxID=2790941 RepID=UPI00397F0634